MTQKENIKQSSLRQRAEAFIRYCPEKITQLSLDETKHLIHELNVHRIELEMQNDELKQTRNELEKEKTKYQHLFEFAPMGYLITDKDGLILNANQTAANLFGNDKQNMMKMKFSQCCCNGDVMDAFHIHLRKTVKRHAP